MLQNYCFIFVQDFETAAGRCDTDAKGWGDPEIDENQQYSQNTCSKLPGTCFLQDFEALQAAATQMQSVVGPNTCKEYRFQKCKFQN